MGRTTENGELLLAVTPSDPLIIERSLHVDGNRHVVERDVFGELAEMAGLAELGEAEALIVGIGADELLRRDEVGVETERFELLGDVGHGALGDRAERHIEHRPLRAAIARGRTDI